jgi:ABC-2 type transport system permease protein
MLFLCGLFFPIDTLPVFLRPFSYLLPLTYGVDILHGAIHGRHTLPLGVDFSVMALFCVALFALSVRNVYRKWIM